MIEKSIKVVLNSRNAKYYKDLGYKIPQNTELNNTKLGYSKGTEIKVKVEDLTKGSKAKVKRICDNCSKEDLVTWRDMGSIEFCSKCSKSRKSKGKNNPMYGKTINRTYPPKLPKKICLDCGVELASRRALRCVSCNGLSRKGSKGLSPSPETRAKISKAVLGKKHSPKVKLLLSQQRISKAFKVFLEKITQKSIELPLKPSLKVFCEGCGAINTPQTKTLRGTFTEKGRYLCRKCGVSESSATKILANCKRKGFADEEAFLAELIRLIDLHKSSCGDPLIYEAMKSTPSHLTHLLNLKGLSSYLSKYKTRSAQESQIYDFLSSNYSGEIVQNYRPTFLKGLEVDLYLPALKLAIEFNGLYWHCAIHKKADYHLQKRKLCTDNEIRLIQINGDEWEYKQSIVKSLLLITLKTPFKRIFARKTKLVKVSRRQSKEFVETHHLMGDFKAATAIGLFLDGELVQLMTYRKHKTGIDISRLCSKKGYLVVGGVSKLLKYIEHEVKPEFIQSFVDLRYADGHSLLSLGYILDKITLGWKWTDYKLTFNRLKCRANMDFRKLTEKQHAIELKWSRIYDAGQAKFIKKL